MSPSKHGRAQGECGGEASTIGDPAGRDHGNWGDSIHHRGDQAHRAARHPRMSPGVPSLGDDDIGTCGGGLPRLRQGLHLTDGLASRVPDWPAKGAGSPKDNITAAGLASSATSSADDSSPAPRG